MSQHTQTTQHVAVNDRALNFGDGCFTTIAVSNGKAEFLRAHISRLQKGCSVLFIDFSDWNDVQNEIEKIASDMECGVIKVLISRGCGGRGYSPVGAQKPHLIVTQHPLPAHYENWRIQGVTIGLSEIKIASQPLLKGIKHLNRLEQVLIKQQLETSDFDDVLVTDYHGFVVESSAGNVFWRKGEAWYTPDLTQSGVEGVIKKQIQAWLNKHGVPHFVVKAKEQIIRDADEVFICNSLMKVVPVTGFQCSQGKLSRYTIDKTRPIMRWLQQSCYD